jgi:hypothetical protein
MNFIKGFPFHLKHIGAIFPPCPSAFLRSCLSVCLMLIVEATLAVTFVDVTNEAGIEFQHINGATPTKYTVETMGSGAAFFDFDSDGDLDIYLVNSAHFPKPFRSYEIHTEPLPINRLFSNNGDGTFTDVTAQAGVGDTSYGMGCAVGDIDNDGDADLYVTNFGRNILYRNNGDGTFADITAEANVGDDRWSASASFLDYDLDGFLDLYVLNYLDYTFEKNRIWRNKSGLPIYCGPSYYFAETDALYHNNGDGTFTDVTQEMRVSRMSKGLGVICGDMDEDGFPDIYIANDTRANFLYWNQSGELFKEVGAMLGVAHDERGFNEAGMGVDMGDYDRDGRFDLFITNFSGETNTLYHNRGEDGFANVTEAANLGRASWLSLGFGTKFCDFDNDGFLDIFVANGHINDLIEKTDEEVTYAQANQLFENNGDGTFTDVSSHSGEHFSTRKVGRGTAFGDYDNDGDIDLLINNNGQSAVLLRNDGGNRNNWLKVQAIGTSPLISPQGSERNESKPTDRSPAPSGNGEQEVRSSSRDSIGAHIKVVTGDFVQLEEVRSGGSYLSDHDRRVHFGLGESTQVDLVEIRWSSQRVDRVENVPANRLLIITEGKGHEIVELR